MTLSLNQAIRTLTSTLQQQSADVDERAALAAEACAAIEERMGLDFAENLLTGQLEAIRRDRDFIGFMNIFGLALYKKVKYDLAINCFLYRIKHNPKDKIAYNNLGLTYNRLGRSREAAESYQKGLDADPHYKQAGSNLLYLQHYIWGANARQIADDHRAYAQMHYETSENKMQAVRVDCRPDRQLRIGFHSADLRFHAVSRFIQGLFAEMDRSQFELFVYHSYTGAEDTITDILKSYPLSWTRVRKLDTEQLTNKIQADRIDILFDLAVYTQGGNPDLFAQQVAPIQINYLGYPDTSGIPALNYRITDWISDPQGVDDLYSEKLLRLPAPLWNYTPWPNLPDPVGPPCRHNGFITFGSMNNHAKLQSEWFEVWAQVLKAVPDSVLLIKSRAMNSERTGPSVYQRFAQWGIAADRIIAKGFNNRPNEHFLTFHEIDIALDTVPYCGTTTTFDSLWMGVPVVTMTGELHVTRTSASILTGMGFEDWVAQTPQQFVEICRQLASAPEKLVELRQSMRSRMQSTSLGDAAQFCRHMETLLRTVWRDYCEAQPPQLREPEPVTGQATEIPQRKPPARSVSSPPVSAQAAAKGNQPAAMQTGLFESNPKVSVIVCGSSEAMLTLYRRHVEQTIGIPFEFIGIDNENNQYSLTAAYNAGGQMANTDVLVFAHDDVFFSTADWGQIVLDKFSSNDKLGLVGLAGTAFLQSRFPFWVAAKAPFIHGRVIHHSSHIKVSHYSPETTDQPAVAIDGLLMISSKTAFDQHGFDEEVFDGFHFYDLDYSVRVSETHDVIVTHDILVKHLSGGSFDDVWKKYRDRFRSKHPGKVWQCRDGQPDADAHKQRLTCHTPADKVFSQQEMQDVTRLGIEHPKHPDHQPVD